MSFSDEVEDNQHLENITNSEKKKKSQEPRPVLSFQGKMRRYSADDEDASLYHCVH